MCCYNDLEAVRDLKEKYPDVLTAYKIIRDSWGSFCGAWQRHYNYKVGNNPAFNNCYLTVNRPLAVDREAVTYGIHVYTDQAKAEEVLNRFRSSTHGCQRLALIAVKCDMKYLIAAEYDIAVFSQITIEQEEFDHAREDISKYYSQD